MRSDKPIDIREHDCNCIDPVVIGGRKWSIEDVRRATDHCDKFINFRWSADDLHNYMQFIASQDARHHVTCFGYDSLHGSCDARRGWCHVDSPVKEETHLASRR